MDYNLLNNLFLEAKGNSIPKSLCFLCYNVAWAQLEKVAFSYFHPFMLLVSDNT